MTVRADLACFLQCRFEVDDWHVAAAAAGIPGDEAFRLYCGKRAKLQPWLSACRLVCADPAKGRHAPALARRALPAGEFLPWIFGAQVRALRTARGLTVAAAAAGAGISGPAWARIERLRRVQGAPPPSVDIATAVARFLELDLFSCCARTAGTGEVAA